MGGPGDDYTYRIVVAGRGTDLRVYKYDLKTSSKRKTTTPRKTYEREKSRPYYSPDTVRGGYRFDANVRRSRTTRDLLAPLVARPKEMI